MVWSFFYYSIPSNSLKTTSYGVLLNEIGSVLNKDIKKEKGEITDTRVFPHSRIFSVRLNGKDYGIVYVKSPIFNRYRLDKVITAKSGKNSNSSVETAVKDESLVYVLEIQNGKIKAYDEQNSFPEDIKNSIYFFLLIWIAYSFSRVSKQKT